MEPGGQAATHFSTFPAGLTDLVLGIVAKDYPTIRVIRSFENAILFTAGDDRLPRFWPYFQNTFNVVDQIDCSPSDPVEGLAIQLEGRIDSTRLRRAMGRCRHFRLVFSQDGRLVPVDGTVRERLEHLIRRDSGVGTRRRDADAEIWIVVRREGAALLLARDTRSASRRVPDRPKGMLSPELGSLLCRFSDPSEDDVFLDPFCGHGGIFLERMRWKYRMAFAIDRDAACIGYVKHRLERDHKDWRKRTYVRTGDGAELSGFEAGFVTRIVTDPPWGEFDGAGAGDVNTLYARLLATFSRVLAPGGVLVLLAGRSIDVGGILSDRALPLAVHASHDLLVSGKKATVFKMVRG